MLGRWFFLAVVGIGLVVIVHGQRSNASSGTVTVACSAATAGGDASAATATVKWNAPAQAEQVWFDLGVTPTFVDGTWSGHGPMAPDATTFTTDPLASGVHYYYRVNALQSGDWRAGASGSFIADCTSAASSP